MIGAILMLADDVIEIRVIGNTCYFKTTHYGSQWAPIEGLKLNYEGAIKEFPDLHGDPDWETKVIMRFKEKIASLPTEDEKIDYIIEDLRNYGYKPKYKQKQGWRPQKII